MTKYTDFTRANTKVLGARHTEPNPPMVPGGLAIIPRRSADAGLLTTRAAVARFAADSPLRLLTYLIDVHPALSLAIWNALRLTTSGARLVAVDAATREQDDSATAELDALFASLPPEIGGFRGLFSTGVLWAMLTGLPFYEAVPGKRGEGVRLIVPVDSLTIRFVREGEDQACIPHQRQVYPQSSLGTIGYVPLPPQLCFWAPIDTLPEDPYGRAPYAAALSECLRDLAMIADVQQVIHRVGYPRGAVGFNFAEMFKLAQEVFSITDPTEAREFVMEQFTATVTACNALSPEEWFHFDSNGNFQVIEGAKGFTGLEQVLVFLRQRITQAVKSLPTLMGINDGSTQTYTTVEWHIYAAAMEDIRTTVGGLLEQIASLHFRLQGRPLLGKLECEPIRTTDAQIEAQTEALKIANEARKRDEGWQTNDDAAQAITGTDAVAEPIRPQPMPAPQKTSTRP